MPEPTIDGFVAGMIRDHGDQMLVDAKGALVQSADHGHRTASRRILDRCLGGVPDGMAIDDPAFYRRIEKLVRDMKPARAAEIGLENILPPENIHFVARQRNVFFDFRNADAFAGNLTAAGFDFAPGARILDFGCSSGRTLRTFEAAWPDMDWFGVDPLDASIEWAREAMPSITYAVSGHAPPLDFPDARFDAVYAASVWSHFAGLAALDWFAEMARIVRPGGYLCVTTHGFYDVAKRVGKSKIALDHGIEIVPEMARNGFAFWANLAKGRRGGKTDTWGTGFFSRDWVQKAVLGARWTLERFAAGQWGGRQDMYVLRRCAA